MFLIVNIFCKKQPSLHSVSQHRKPSMRFCHIISQSRLNSFRFIFLSFQTALKSSNRCSKMKNYGHGRHCLPLGRRQLCDVRLYRCRAHKTKGAGAVAPQRRPGNPPASGRPRILSSRPEGDQEQRDTQHRHRHEALEYAALPQRGKWQCT